MNRDAQIEWDQILILRFYYFPKILQIYWKECYYVPNFYHVFRRFPLVKQQKNLFFSGASLQIFTLGVWLFSKILQMFDFGFNNPVVSD